MIILTRMKEEEMVERRPGGLETTQDTSRTLVGSPMAATLVGSSSTRRGTQHLGMPSGTEAQPINVDDIIELSDDDEKENVPVPTRRVRRRIEPDSPIIDLSCD